MPTCLHALDAALTAAEHALPRRGRPVERALALWEHAPGAVVQFFHGPSAALPGSFALLQRQLPPALAQLQCIRGARRLETGVWLCGLPNHNLSLAESLV